MRNLALALCLLIATTGIALSAPRVKRAQFAAAIASGRPIGVITAVPNSVKRVYFFTELDDCARQVITHRWEYRGRIMKQVHFKVGGPRWRVYSSKRLKPRELGEWMVSVLDADGNTLAVSTFTYISGVVMPSRPLALEMH